ncbi:hypothetical protein BZA70DRAFT_287202 [Myxozyma melibiosi]|uniref:Chromo domain-containing protein n=1 Tax=Myxozyma melibiosi TaxID=54550 RepID=A0ABR1FDD6_9ASCO
MSDGEEEYFVEAILDHRYNEVTGTLEFKIKWEGYDEIGWEPYKNLTGCDELLDEYYHKVNGGRKLPKHQAPKPDKLGRAKKKTRKPAKPNRLVPFDVLDDSTAQDGDDDLDLIHDTANGSHNDEVDDYRDQITSTGDIPVPRNWFTQIEKITGVRFLSNEPLHYDIMLKNNSIIMVGSDILQSVAPRVLIKYLEDHIAIEKKPVTTAPAAAEDDDDEVFADAVSASP